MKIAPALLVLILFSLLLLDTGVTKAEMKKLSSSSMRNVTGQTGIAFRLNNWRIDGGDASLELEGGNGNTLTVGDFRVSDPSGPIDDPNPISEESGPCQNTGPCSTGDGGRMVSGTVDNPFQINATDAGNGRIALDFPGTQEAFEMAHIQFTLEMNGNALGTVGIGNALWAGGTRFAMGVRPDGGIDLGIALQLDGDAWLATEIPSSFDNDGIYMEGIFGAGSFNSGQSGCDIASATFDDSCFDGALTWADLDANRPLQIDFGSGSSPRLIRIERVSVSSGGQGSIGINELGFDNGTNHGSFSLGSTVVDSVNIQHFQLDGPI